MPIVSRQSLVVLRDWWNGAMDWMAGRMRRRPRRVWPLMPRGLQPASPKQSPHRFSKAAHPSGGVTLHSHRRHLEQRLSWWGFHRLSRSPPAALLLLLKLFCWRINPSLRGHGACDGQLASFLMTDGNYGLAACLRCCVASMPYFPVKLSCSAALQPSSVSKYVHAGVYAGSFSPSRMFVDALQHSYTEQRPCLLLQSCAADEAHA